MVRRPRPWAAPTAAVLLFLLGRLVDFASADSGNAYDSEQGSQPPASTYTAATITPPAPLPTTPRATAVAGGLSAGATCGPWTLPRAIPFSIPCPFSLGVTAGSLPPGFGPGPLTAGAVCGPYTLPINLPFSPPCPYSGTAAGSAETGGSGVDPAGGDDGGVVVGAATTTVTVAAATPAIPSTTIYAPGHSPSLPESLPVATSSPLPSSSTAAIVTATPPPSAVIITKTLTLVPDPPLTGWTRAPGAAGGDLVHTTLVTLKRK